MWPNANQNNPKEDKLKEYHRQQEKLKAMTPSLDKTKVLSTDVMIENLLNQRETFKRVAPSGATATQNEKSNLDSNLPGWLQCDSSMLPPMYKHVWSLVKNPTFHSVDRMSFADTAKLSQLLLTSGLHTDVLGYIWNLANKMVPGQLTQQELYIVLALVGLAQNGCTFNNLSVLNLIPSAPIPMLQLSSFGEQAVKEGSSDSSNDVLTKSISVLENELSLTVNKYGQKGPAKTSSSVLPTTSDISSTSDANLAGFLGGNDTRRNSGVKGSNFPCIGSSPTAELDASEDDFSDFQSVPVDHSKSGSLVTALVMDDFTDFQSAAVHASSLQKPLDVDPLVTVVITQKRDIPKIPLPKNLNSLKGSVLKISPETERKLKTLSQPESLSSLPESKISSSNKVSTMPSIAVVGGSRGIGSRLANHTLGSKNEKTVKHHHKIHKSKLPLEEVAVPAKVMSQANVDDLFPKCFQKSANGTTTFFLKETKIRSSDAVGPAEPLGVAEQTRTIEIPTLGTLSETVLPAAPAPGPGEALFAVEEDKYSALRDLMVAPSPAPAPAPPAPPAPPSHDADDFGDFLSADLPPGPPVLPVPETPSPWADWGLPTGDPAQDPVASPSVDHFEAFSSDPTPLISVTLDSLDTRPIPMDTFDLLPVSKPFSLPEEQSNQTEIGKGTWDAVGFTVFDAEPADWTRPTEMASSTPDNDFGHLLTPDVKPPDALDTLEALDTMSRHSSLPSLDLKVSPSEETDQEAIGRKCHDVCLALLQEASDIFNSVSSTTVLDEMFSMKETEDYMNNLNVAYHISKRISHVFFDSSTLHEELEKLWRRLDDYCYHYNLKLREDEDSAAGAGRLGRLCGLCQSPLCSEGVEQGSGVFHPSCANLWVNLVDSSLPCCG